MLVVVLSVKKYIFSAVNIQLNLLLNFKYNFAWIIRNCVFRSLVICPIGSVSSFCENKLLRRGADCVW